MTKEFAEKWLNNLKEYWLNKDITKAVSLFITLSCIIGSLILSYLLTLIPGQRIAFMDASSNIINLCGVVLMILRFKESWWIWLINNIIDLGIWIITFASHERRLSYDAISIYWLFINKHLWNN